MNVSFEQFWPQNVLDGLSLVDKSPSSFIKTDDCVKSSPKYKASIQIVRTGYRVLRDYGLTDWFQKRSWKGIVVASMLSFIRFRCALHKCPVNMFKSKE